jgi:hypothetical protein
MTSHASQGCLMGIKTIHLSIVEGIGPVGLRVRSCEEERAAFLLHRASQAWLAG